MSHSIASTFANCLELYQRLRFSLERDNSNVASQIDLSKVSDEYGRLNVWGSDVGALRVGRGSLDDALRNEDRMRSIVQDILRDLVDNLERGMSLSLRLNFGCVSLSQLTTYSHTIL